MPGPIFSPTPTAGTKTVKIANREFLYRPIMGNPGKVFMTGDVACLEWIAQNEFGTLLVYEGPQNIKTTDNTPIDYWFVKNAG